MNKILIDKRRDYYVKSKLFKILRRVKGKDEPVFLQYIYCPQFYVNEVICWNDCKNMTNANGDSMELCWEEVKLDETSNQILDYLASQKSN